MKTEDFDYYLPEELIAQTPLKKRDSSRLLVLDRKTGEVEHKHFSDIHMILLISENKTVHAITYGHPGNNDHMQ